MQDISQLDGLIDLLVEAVLRELQSVGEEQTEVGAEGRRSGEGEQDESHE